jgi:hypothetical protein
VGAAAGLFLLALGPVAGTALAADGSASKQLAQARAPVSELERASTHELRGGAEVVRYEQEVGGVTVLDAEAVVTDSPDASAELVSDATSPDVDKPPEPTVDPDAAARIAADAAGATKLAGAPRTELVLDSAGGGTLTWQVLVSSADPPAAFEVLVDARSGVVADVTEITREARGEAKIFDPNPVVTNGGVGDLEDAGDSDSSDLTSLRQPVTLLGLQPRQKCLVGRWAWATRQAVSVCRDGRDFSAITRGPDSFEAVMAYFHVDATQRYIQSLDIQAGINDRRQRLRVNQFSDDNSYYDPGNREIRMGTGGVDDGEDAEVIVHEYGHAIQDDQAPGFGDTLGGGAVGEGFGDYMAAVMSSQASGGMGGFFDVCIFDWDAVSYSDNGCGRTIATGHGLDDIGSACRSSVHCRGQVWSSGLWRLRATLGTDSDGNSVVDSVVLSSNFMLDSNDDEADAARKLIEADELLYPTGDTDGDSSVHGMHEDEIRDEMESRDYL